MFQIIELSIRIVTCLSSHSNKWLILNPSLTPESVFLIASKFSSFELELIFLGSKRYCTSNV